MQAHPFAFCADISTGELPPFAGIPAAQQEFFARSEIRKAHYAGVDWNGIAPLDEELILQMRECEAVFMAVVTRLEDKHAVPYLTRKLWYLRHLQFWNDYLTRRRINLYLSAWTPHEIPDIVIYYLCRQRGIPVLFFDITTLRDVACASRDVRHVTPQIGERYRVLLAERPTGAPESVPLREPFASYERDLLSVAGKPPVLMSIPLPTHGYHLRTLALYRPFALFLPALRILFTPAGWARAWEALQRWRAVRRTEHFYNAHASVPDLTKPFVYFPLHSQPELSTVPLGGVYADQILAARLLNATLPDGVLLYVKEHPRRGGWLSRNTEYYRDFLELEKVRLIPKDVDTFILRERCTAVATITGSAGFEALFRGKQVFLFGSWFYQYARGVFPIRTARDCAEAVRAVFERREAPTPWSTHLYLKAMEETCMMGVVDRWFLLVTGKSEEEHVKALKNAIGKELAALQDEITGVASAPSWKEIS